MEQKEAIANAIQVGWLWLIPISPDVISVGAVIIARKEIKEHSDTVLE